MKHGRQLTRLGVLLAGLFTLAMSGIRAEPRDETPPPVGMVLIPAGTFEMGSADEEADDDEQPVHTVHLDAFFMDTYEVTNAQFKAFVDANPAWGKNNIDAWFHWGGYLRDWEDNTYPPGKANHPVIWMSWYAAMAYAEWAGKRLPTEAEWEYAARGGLEGQKYPWGNTITHADANYDKHVNETTPVGAYAANGYGLYDMAGNVREWCLDAYDADFYDVSDNSRNPISGGIVMLRIQWLLDDFTGMARVLRGGSWVEDARYLRVAKRAGSAPANPYLLNGFRCAKNFTP